MTTNDENIIELKAKIAEKKAQLETKFEPKTSMRIELNGNVYNVENMQSRELTQTAILLKGYVMAAKELGLLESLTFSGYNAELWIEDILQRIKYLETKAELTKLQLTETKLERLLSEEKKKEIEIEKIRADLTS